MKTRILSIYISTGWGHPAEFTSWARDFHHFTDPMPSWSLGPKHLVNFLFEDGVKFLVEKKNAKTTSTSTSLKVLVLLQERFPLYTPNCSSWEALQQVWQLLSHLGTSSYFQLLFAGMPRTPLILDPWFWGSISSQRWLIKASKNKGKLDSFCEISACASSLNQEKSM